MKKSFSLLSAFLLCLIVFAQNYDFTVSNQTYENLEGSTSLNNGDVWDDPEYVVLSEFPIQFYNYSVNAFTISGFGFLNAYESSNLQDTLLNLIFPFAADLIDRGFDDGISLSNISYKTEGTQGSRILKIEWQNAGFYDDTTGVDFVNFQVWFYEANNNIEFHYGPVSVSQPELIFYYNNGPLVGLGTNYSYYSYYIESAVFLSDDPTMPQVNYFYDQSYNAFYYTGLTDVIPNNTVYTFSPQVVGISDYEEISQKIIIHYNNLTGLNIKLNDPELEIQKMSIFKSNGQLLLSGIITDQNSLINTSDLLADTYIIQFESNFGLISKKFSVLSN